MGMPGIGMFGSKETVVGETVLSKANSNYWLAIKSLAVLYPIINPEDMTTVVSIEAPVGGPDLPAVIQKVVTETAAPVESNEFTYGSNERMLDVVCEEEVSYKPVELDRDWSLKPTELL